MTAPDPRVGEIQAVTEVAVDAALYSFAHAPYEPPMNEEEMRLANREQMKISLKAAVPHMHAYLLAELRKRDEKLARVEARTARLERSKHSEDREIAEDLRAAMGAREMSGAVFNLPAESSTCKQSLQVALMEVLSRHAKSYNTDRSGVGYIACRCGLEMRLDGSSCADDARTLAAHQTGELLPLLCAAVAAANGGGE